MIKPLFYILTATISYQGAIHIINLLVPFLASAEDVAHIVYFTTFTSLLTVFLSFGLNSILVRDVSLNHHNIKECQNKFSTYLTVLTQLILISLIPVAAICSYLLDFDYLKAFLYILATILMVYSRVFYAVLNGLSRYKEMCYIGIFSVFISGFVIYFTNIWGGEGFVLSKIFGELVILLAGWAIIVKLLPVKRTLKARKISINFNFGLTQIEIIKESFLNMSGLFLNKLVFSIEFLLLFYLLGAQSVIVQDISKLTSLINLTLFLPSIFSIYALPRISQEKFSRTELIAFILGNFISCYIGLSFIFAIDNYFGFNVFSSFESKGILLGSLSLLYTIEVFFGALVVVNKKIWISVTSNIASVFLSIFIIYYGYNLTKLSIDFVIAAIITTTISRLFFYLLIDTCSNSKIRSEIMRIAMRY